MKYTTIILSLLPVICCAQQLTNDKLTNLHPDAKTSLNSIGMYSDTNKPTPAAIGAAAIADKATTPDATAGTDNEKWMTSLRTREGVSAWASSTTPKTLNLSTGSTLAGDGTFTWGGTASIENLTVTNPMGGLSASNLSSINSFGLSMTDWLGGGILLETPNAITLNGNPVTALGLTCPSQNAANPNHALTAYTLEESAANTLWTSPVFTVTGESRSTADMTQSLFGSTVAYLGFSGATPATGDFQWAMLYPASVFFSNRPGQNMPVSGPTTAWSLSWWANHSSSTSLDIWTTVGGPTYPTSLPNGTAYKCWYAKHSLADNTITIGVSNGTTLSASSPIALPSAFAGSDSNKNKFILTWSGSKLSIYGLAVTLTSGRYPTSNRMMLLAEFTPDWAGIGSTGTAGTATFFASMNANSPQDGSVVIYDVKAAHRSISPTAP